MQSVTSVGNQTSIAIFGTAGFGTTEETFDIVNTSNDVRVRFNNISTGSASTKTFEFGALTGGRTWDMPDANGRFVLSVNGNAPDAAGDVTVSAGSGTVTNV